MSMFGFSVLWLRSLGFVPPAAGGVRGDAAALSGRLPSAAPPTARARTRSAREGVRRKEGKADPRGASCKQSAHFGTAEYTVI
eukprot:3343947-Alexandrium_andersonii.AAC.1